MPDGELGEIVIRGRNVLSGCPGRRKETSAAFIDGWFRTGDLGRKDADGFISIVDRTKDVIIRGGFNVYPHEVEEVLLRHPAIAEAAVIGLPHATPGEESYGVLIDKHGDAFRRRTRLRTSDARCARPLRGRRHRSRRRLRAHRRQTGCHPAAPESRPGRAGRGGAVAQSRTTASRPLAQHVAAIQWGVRGARRKPAVLTLGPGWAGQTVPGFPHPPGLAEAVRTVESVVLG